MGRRQDSSPRDDQRSLQQHTLGRVSREPWALIFFRLLASGFPFARGAHVVQKYMGYGVVLSPAVITSELCDGHGWRLGWTSSSDERSSSSEVRTSRRSSPVSTTWEMSW